MYHKKLKKMNKFFGYLTEYFGYKQNRTSSIEQNIIIIILFYVFLKSELDTF